MSTTSPKQLENQVIKQSKLFDKQLPDLRKLAILKGKFVAFYDGKTVFGDSHQECFTKAEDTFGAKGYVIEEITNQKLYLSSLVKL